MKGSLISKCAAKFFLFSNMDPEFDVWLKFGSKSALHGSDGWRVHPGANSW